MSRDFGMVSTSVHRSKKLRTVPHLTRYFYLYLLTSKHGNSVGCFVLPPDYAAGDLEMTEADAQEHIDRLCEASLIGWDSQEEIVRIVGYVEHAPPTNPKHAAGMARVARELPDCPQKALLYKDLATAPYLCDNPEITKFASENDSLSQGYRNTETETETETIPPTPPSGEHPPQPVRKDPKGYRLPDDWRPPSGIAEEEGLTAEEEEREGAKFRDYWIAQPAAKGRKLDWDATWRNWIRRAADDRRKSNIQTLHGREGGAVAAFAVLGN